MNDYNAAGKQKARDEAKRYLEDVEAKHAQWVVDRELGRPVGEEPPTPEQIKRRVEAAQAKAEEIDAIRARLEAEVRQRESDLASEKRKLSDAVGRVLLPSFIDLAKHYRSLQDQLARVKQHLRVLSSATVNVTSPEHRHWDSIHDDPREDTNALRDAISKLNADADADVGAIIAALKEGHEIQQAAPPPKPCDEASPREGYNRYGGRIT
jgi:predicted  nucleic acid-binding Zn-ribbon protein